MNILVTGVAGFIGFHTALMLLKKNYKIVGVDNLNDYYDTNLKKRRLQILKKYENFFFTRFNIEDKEIINKFKNSNFDCVINLAAQAGVRYSLKNPYAYINSNILGHLNVLELVKTLGIKKFIYASSSSVYGGNKKFPFSVKDRVDKPVSLYAASKKSCELVSECYSKLYNIQCIGLRFFTVYGPWGRPDMATYIFTQNIINRESIDVFNHGNMKRDFTYIDDIIKGIEGAINCRVINHRIFNLGNNNSEKLLDFINIIEDCLGIRASMNFLPLQPGDVPETFAEIDSSKKELGFKPTTKISEGIPKFIKWFKEYHDLE